MSQIDVSRSIQRMVAKGPVTATSFQPASKASKEMQDWGELAEYQALLKGMDTGIIAFHKSGRVAVVKQVSKGNEVDKALDKNRRTRGTKAWRAARMAKAGGITFSAGMVSSWPLATVLPHNPIGWAIGAGILTLISVGAAVGAVGLHKYNKAQGEFADALPD